MPRRRGEIDVLIASYHHLSICSIPGVLFSRHFESFWDILRAPALWKAEFEIFRDWMHGEVEGQDDGWAFTAFGGQDGRDEDAATMSKRNGRVWLAMTCMISGFRQVWIILPMEPFSVAGSLHESQYLMFRDVLWILRSMIKMSLTRKSLHILEFQWPVEPGVIVPRVTWDCRRDTLIF